MNERATDTVDEIGEIVSDFGLLEDWEQRYQYLTELGEALPVMPEAEKTDSSRVKACMSKVWVFAWRDPEHPERIRLHGDCDTPVIKGVVALLVQLFSGKTPEAIAALDVDLLFERLQLAENLSPNRHVGVYAIVDVLREQVAGLQP